jgi:uncharacterized protein (DUF302 family)
MAMMDTMVKSISKDKREQMMVDMMPMMMEGMDINDLMPRMMVAMFKDVTADDVAAYLKETLQDKEKLKEMADKMLAANPMVKMMMQKHQSKLGFEETIAALKESIPRHNWQIPDTRDLQKLWQESGISDAQKIHILYLCNAKGGYDMTRQDDMLPMTVMMPMGLSIYETSTGTVEIAHMNLKLMSEMFSGTTCEVLKSSADNLAAALQDVTAGE